MKKQKAKPGSSSDDAKSIGGKGDFGVPESDVVERTYTSANTRYSDPGHAEPRGGANSCETGVGANASGPASSSGGDLDPDMVGIGTGRGVSQSGPDTNFSGGPDEAQNQSSRHSSLRAPVQHLNQPGAGESTVSRTKDASTGADAQGADAATNPSARQDDSFSAEISTDEASGRNSR